MKVHFVSMSHILLLDLEVGNARKQELHPGWLNCSALLLAPDHLPLLPVMTEFLNFLGCVKNYDLPFSAK